MYRYDDCNNTDLHSSVDDAGNLSSLLKVEGELGGQGEGLKGLPGLEY